MRKDPARGNPRIHSAVVVVLNMYLLRHMIRLYAQFDGDLLEAIVLGEIAHHNVSAVLTAARTTDELLDGLSRVPAKLLPTNAHSIALATGIPRQTVRRKVAALVARGWLHKDAGANLTLAGELGQHFASFNVDSLREFMQTSRTVTDLLARAAPGEGARDENAAPRRPRRAPPRRARSK